MLAALAFVVLAALPLLHETQSPRSATAREAQPPSAVIGGRVTDRTTGVAVPGIQVTLTQREGSPSLEAPVSHIGVTDSSGRYVFTGLPAGAYTLLFEP